MHSHTDVLTQTHYTQTHTNSTSHTHTHTYSYILTHTLKFTHNSSRCAHTHTDTITHSHVSSDTQSCLAAVCIAHSDSHITDSTHVFTTHAAHTLTHSCSHFLFCVIYGNTHTLDFSHTLWYTNAVTLARSHLQSQKLTCICSGILAHSLLEAHARLTYTHAPCDILCFFWQLRKSRLSVWPAVGLSAVTLVSMVRSRNPTSGAFPEQSPKPPSVGVSPQSLH